MPRPEVEPAQDPLQPQWVRELKQMVKSGEIRNPELRRDIMQL
jgi:hypothetical protein